MKQNGASAYQHTRVLSSSREQLVPLLYEKAIGHLRRAAAQIGARDLDGKAVSVQKASDILFELLATLDFEAGGELASRLSALYSFFLTEIGEASRTLDRDRLDHVVAMLGTIHESWAQAAVEVQGGAAADRHPAYGGSS